MNQLYLFEGCGDPHDMLDPMHIFYVGRLLFGNRVRPQAIGPNYKGLCVYHDETTPSFYLKPDQNWFKCYGCGKFGGPVRLIFDFSPDPQELLGRLAPNESIDELVAKEEEKFNIKIGFGL